MTIKISVDIKRLKEIADPEQFHAIFGLADAKIYNHEAYQLLLNFVVDENGNALTPDEARKFLKGKVTQLQLENDVVPEFLTACRNALVNPTNGSS